MIIALILVALTIAVIVTVVILVKNYVDVLPEIIGGVSTVLLVAALLSTGVIMICNKCAESSTLYTWETQATFLRSRKEILENTDLRTAVWLAEVNQHNAEVKDFVVMLNVGRTYRSNPWISWYCQPAFESFDMSLVEGLECTITGTSI